MPRYAACVQYLGSAYAGWQAQPHADSVQVRVETALSRVADAPVRVVCAGRTDAGVHAAGQVVHFDVPSPRPPRAWVFGGNTRLPADISLRWARLVPDDFHARYAAEWRAYRYLLFDHPARDALTAGRVTHSRYRLNADVMHAAAQPLLGEHDFSAFRAAGCQSRTPWRRLQQLRVERRRGLIVIEVRANAFLHHMVRNLAGTLIQVGRGQRDAGWPARLLAGGDRTVAGPTAPADGLYLRAVGYPKIYGLPDAPAESALIAGGGGW